MSSTRRAAIAGLLGAGIGSGLPSLAIAQTPAPPVEPVLDEAPTQLDTGHDRFEHILAPVAINGQGPFQFVIDTGANTSCVSRDLAARLALTAGPPARVHTMIGVRERPSVLIDRLDIGGRSRKTVSAPSLPIMGDGVDGILGIDWLKGQRLFLGFKARTMQITRSREERPIEGQVVIPARRRMGQLTIVDADLGNRRISAMIDSGSQVTICNGALRDILLASETRAEHAAPHQQISLETLAGEPFTGELLYMPFLRLGGLHLGNVPVVYAQNMHVFNVWNLTDTPAVILGMDLLTQFDAVSLDFGRSKVRFDISAAQAVRA